MTCVALRNYYAFKVRAVLCNNCALLLCFSHPFLVPVTVPPLPAVQPFHALVYPLTLTQTRTLSQAYADRCA